MSQSKQLKLFREAFLALSISVFGGLVTGSLWTNLNSTLSILVGILAIVPVIGQMRGNISGIFTSRLGTGLHLGSIEPSLKNRSKELNNTLIMNILVSFFSPIWVAIVVYVFHYASGGDTKFFHFIIIALIAGIISAGIQIILTLYLAFKIYKSGRDPDVLAYPILSATGDVITAIGIFGGFFVNQLISNQSSLFMTVTEIFVVIILIMFILIVFSRPIRSKLEFDVFNLLSETVPVIFFSVIIGGFVGIILDSSHLSVIILFIIPSYMAYTGSLGAIVGSHYTTAYYLGSLESQEGKINMYLITPLFLIIIGFTLSILLGVIGFFVADLIHLEMNNINFASFLIINVLTGVTTTLFSIFNALFVGNITFQRGLDADNVIVPLTSTFGDLVAILSIMLALSLVVAS